MGDSNEFEFEDSNQEIVFSSNLPENMLDWTFVNCTNYRMLFKETNEPITVTGCKIYEVYDQQEEKVLLKLYIHPNRDAEEYIKFQLNDFNLGYIV